MSEGEPESTGCRDPPSGRNSRSFGDGLAGPTVPESAAHRTSQTANGVGRPRRPFLPVPCSWRQPKRARGTGLEGPAVFAGMGSLGDAASVPVMADAAANRQGPEQLAARQSLATLPGPDVDSAIVFSPSHIQRKNEIPTRTRRWRAAHRAVRRHPDSGHRRLRRGRCRPNALRGLRNTAGPAQVAPLLNTLQSAGDSYSKDAAQSLAAALRRSLPDQIAIVVTACRAATSAVRRAPRFWTRWGTHRTPKCFRSSARSVAPFRRWRPYAPRFWPLPTGRIPAPDTRSARGGAIECESCTSNAVLTRCVETGVRAFATIPSRDSEAAYRRHESRQEPAERRTTDPSSVRLSMRRSIQAGLKVRSPTPQSRARRRPACNGSGMRC